MWDLSTVQSWLDFLDCMILKNIEMVIHITCFWHAQAGDFICCAKSDAVRTEPSPS